MNLRILYYLNIFFVLIGSLQSQEPIFEFGPWKHQSLNGLVQAEGLYRTQETIYLSGKTEQPITKKLYGQLVLNSRSYIWHPNFWKLNIDLDYNPGVHDEKFLVTPNRSETRTAEQLRLQSVFFNQRPLSFNLFFNINHHYINREYTSSVEALTRDFGGALSFRNDIVPLTINYLKSDWIQNELETGREFFNHRENIRAELSKSFIPGDFHRFSYSYDDYNRKYGNGPVVHNIINSWRIQNNVPLNAKRQNYLHSLIFFHKQTGNQHFDRLQISENLTYTLPLGFKASGLYRYAGYDQLIQNSKQHNLSARLEHQLFSSLHSSAYYEYRDITHTAYDDHTNIGELTFDYIKEIPTGNLSLGYTYRKRNDNRQTGTAKFRVSREKYTLNDYETVLLDNPYVDPASVYVTDATGAIIYEENIDYVLLEQGIYLEIQRLPGGQISDGQTVYLDYMVQRSLSYKFDTNNQMFRAGLSLFDRWIDLYFRFHEQTYDNVVTTDNKILKTIYQNVYGIRLSKGFFTIGAEFDDYASNITPYRNMHYFLILSHNFTNRLSASIRGNWRDRELLADNEKQQFADVSGRLVFYLGQKSKINIDGGYRFQQGRGIDLDLSNIRAEYSIRIRALILRIGLEIYRRNFSGEIINYNGGYVRIERNF